MNRLDRQDRVEDRQLAFERQVSAPDGGQLELVLQQVDFAARIGIAVDGGHADRIRRIEGIAQVRGQRRGGGAGLQLIEASDARVAVRV